MATVYFIEAPCQKLVKIGRTNNIERRFAALESMSPVRLVLRATIEGVTSSYESYIHKVFDEQRRHGEWFEINDDLDRLMNDPGSFNVEKYAEFEDSKRLPEFFEETENGDYEFVFGKHDGDLLGEVIKSDYQYIDWMLWKEDFPLCVKELIAGIIDARARR